jgi:hypothetical protein
LSVLLFEGPVLRTEAAGNFEHPPGVSLSYDPRMRSSAALLDIALTRMGESNFRQDFACLDSYYRFSLAEEAMASARRLVHYAPTFDDLGRIKDHDTFSTAET